MGTIEKGEDQHGAIWETNEISSCHIYTAEQEEIANWVEQLEVGNAETPIEEKNKLTNLIR